MNQKKERLIEEERIWLNKYFPDIECVLPPPGHQVELLPITEDSIPLNDREQLLERYRLLGASINECEDIRRLTMLCFNMRMDAYILASFGFDKIRDEAIRQDLLKLYHACTNPDALSGKIEIRSRNNTIRMDNHFNWVQDAMIRGFLKEHLNNLTEMEAYGSYPSKAGRKAYDERAGIIMKGVYTMITESHEFASPMPNDLCCFILFYLELCGIQPSQHKVGAQWVRSQLRYLLSVSQA